MFSSPGWAGCRDYSCLPSGHSPGTGGQGAMGHRERAPHLLGLVLRGVTLAWCWSGRLEESDGLQGERPSRSQAESGRGQGTGPCGAEDPCGWAGR